MTEKIVKVLGAGSPMLDILVNIEESFLDNVPGEKGGMELVSPETLEEILTKTESPPTNAPGGSAANTIFGLARLGMPTALLGKLGKDSNGDYYKSRYQNLGGDVTRFKYNDSVPSGRCLSLVTPDSERTMRTDLGAAATLCPEDLTSSDFEGISHIHVEGYLLFNEGLIDKILVMGKEAGCTVSLDLASFEVVNASKSILPDILREYVDIVFANEDEAAAFCGTENPDEALTAIGEICNTVAVKLGKKGALLKNGTETTQVNAEVVDAVDTTGAGDLWQAGFLYGFLQNQPLSICGGFGAVLGAEVVKVMGAAIPEERWSEIRKRVKL